MKWCTDATRKPLEAPKERKGIRQTLKKTKLREFLWRKTFF